MTAPEHLLMPKLGLTMEEGTVARWAVAPGTPFSAGDIIVVIETDKIANDVEAPADGMLVEILAKEGSVVPVSTPIARWRLDGDRAPAPSPANAISRHEQARTLTPPERGAAQTRHHSSEGRQARAGNGPQRLLSTPYARRLARELGINIAAIAGSGPRGRVKADDVRRAKTDQSHPTPILPAREDAPASASTPSVQGIAGLAAARSLSLAQIEIDTAGLREMERSLASRSPAPLRIALIVMAALRAADEVQWGSVGVEIASPSGPIAVAFAPQPRIRLLSIAALLDGAQPADASNRQDRREGTLLILPGAPGASCFAPTAPPGWAAALGLGAEREVLRRSADGGIGATYVMTVALSYEPARIANASALAFLAALKPLIEEPLGMLAG